MQSRGVVETLLSKPWSGFDSTFLVGNHKRACLIFWGRSDGSAWLSYGGVETLLSYGVAVRRLAPDRQATRELRHFAGAPIAHVAFLSSCVLSHTEGDYVFVHAGVRPGRTMEQQTRDDLLWNSRRFSACTVTFARQGRGAWSHDLRGASDLGYPIDIDSGAFASGRLTCLVTTGGDSTFRQHGSPC